jgi:hypothetical protein
MDNAQSDPTIHKAIDKEGGSLFMTPSPGGDEHGFRTKPSRPIGVISPKAVKGEPHPLEIRITRRLAPVQAVESIA